MRKVLSIKDINNASIEKNYKEMLVEKTAENYILKECNQRPLVIVLRREIVL